MKYAKPCGRLMICGSYCSNQLQSKYITPMRKYGEKIRL